MSLIGLYVNIFSRPTVVYLILIEVGGGTAVAFNACFASRTGHAQS